MTISVTINQQVQQLAQPITIAELQQQLQLPTVGSVFALNDGIIPQGLWEQTMVNDGDTIALFQAIAGG